MTDFVKVAKVSDVPDGQGRLVEVDGRRIGLFRCDGEIYAIDDTCTHAEASLCEGDVDGCEVICPLHFAAFDVRTGEALSPPADEPVATYEVRINGEDVELNPTPRDR